MLKEKAEKRTLFFILAMAFLLINFAIDFHGFLCFTLGFFWPYYLYYEKDPQGYLLFGKWKMTYHRYSFVRAIKTIDQRLNERFNPQKTTFRASIIRVLPGVILFGTLDLFVPLLYIAWELVLIGGVVFELSYPYGQRKWLRWCYTKLAFFR